MNRVIYMALTLAFALSLGGCSSAITTKDLTMIEEAEATTKTTASVTTTPALSDLKTPRQKNSPIKRSVLMTPKAFI